MASVAPVRTQLRRWHGILEHASATNSCTPLGAFHGRTTFV